MEEKEPIKQDTLDLTHLEGFLEEENERLLSGQGVVDNIDSKNSFNAQIFFKKIAERCDFDRYRNDQRLSKAERETSNKTLIQSVADMLYKYLPRTFEALEYRGDDYLKVDLYRNWGYFLYYRQASKECQIKMLTEQGQEQVEAASVRSQKEPAFMIFEYGIERLKEIGHIPESCNRDVRTFIGRHGIKALQAYVSISDNGLRMDNEILNPKDEEHYHYKSYTKPAVKTYGKMMSVLARVTNLSQLKAFTQRAYSELCPAIENSMEGYWYIDKLGNEEKEIHPDSESQVNFLTMSLGGLRRSTPSEEMDDFFVSVHDYVPDMLEKLIKNNQGELCYQLYDRTVNLLPNGQAKESFALAYGSRTAAKLIEKSSRRAGQILCNLRDMLQIEKQDALVLTDPISRDNPVPMAVLTNFSQDYIQNQDYDFVVMFKNRRDIVARNNMDKDSQFLSVMGDKKFMSYHAYFLRHMHNAEHINVGSANFKHHSDYLHSCSFNKLRMY